MIFSENRFPLFRIMLRWLTGRTILRRQGIDLTPRSRESILDCHLSILVPCVIAACVVHHNVLVWWNRQPNVDLKSDPVAMVVTGSDHLHAATCNALVMSFQSLYFT
jgi:hypothetical protein